MGNYIDRYNLGLRLVYPKYHKKPLQTYTTAIEWRNVEMAEEFGQFLLDKKAFYKYPYFSQKIQSLVDIKKALTEQAGFFIPKGTHFDGMIEIGYPGRFVKEFQKIFTAT